MVNKTYCDCCGKEVKQRDSSHLKISPRLIGANDSFNLHEVCNDCVKEIKEFIRELNNGGKTNGTERTR